MQEALGTDYANLNWLALYAAADSDTDHRLHSLPGIAFNFLIQAIACRTVMAAGIFRGRRASAPVPVGYRCRSGVAGI